MQILRGIRNPSRIRGSRYTISPPQLTCSVVTRYASRMKDQWKQGLQWGAVAWLAWIAMKASLTAWSCLPILGNALAPTSWWILASPLLAVLWIAALALTWTRWSRAAVAAAVVVQAITATVDAATYPGDLHIPWALTFWLPMSLPLLPLLFMAPERPRLMVAFAFVGRFREAAATLAGWRWPLVAIGLVALNRAAWDALSWSAYGADGVQRLQLSAFISAGVPCALIFGLAALPQLPRSRATAT